MNPVAKPGLAAGIDLGGSRIKLVCVEARSLRLVHRWNLPTRDGESKDGWPAWAWTIRSMIETLELEVGSVPALGLCAPGLAAQDGRSIAYMPGRMCGMEGFDWTTFLGRSRLVPILNDAHAALLGEVHAGAARGQRNVYLLTLGTGVGGAIYLNGQLITGPMGRAGHLGHLCLDPDGAPDVTGVPGSLEDAIGDHTISKRSGGRFRNTAELVAAITTGDAEADRIWQRAIRCLACGIASLNNILDPDLIILGGGITAAGSLLFEPLAMELNRIEWRPSGRGVPVVCAELGEWAGALGAAFHAALHPESSAFRTVTSDPSTA
jgi:glucokinase